MEKVPFWRKDLGEILGKDIKDLFKPKKEEEEDQIFINSLLMFTNKSGQYF